MKNKTMNRTHKTLLSSWVRDVESHNIMRYNRTTIYIKKTDINENKKKKGGGQ